MTRNESGRAAPHSLNNLTLVGGGKNLLSVAARFRSPPFLVSAQHGQALRAPLPLFDDNRRLAL
jgi:hypothetical protein